MGGGRGPMKGTPGKEGGPFVTILTCRNKSKVFKYSDVTEKSTDISTSSKSNEVGTRDLSSKQNLCPNTRLPFPLVPLALRLTGCHRPAVTVSL